MKALSVWEPFATAIAVGAKRIETRTWPTSYRGPLAICASKREPTSIDVKWVRDRIGGRTLPMRPGCCVAVAHLVDCRRMRPIDLSSALYVDPEKYSWVLDRITYVPGTIHVRGQQGLFDLTADVDRQVLEAIAAGEAMDKPGLLARMEAP